MPLYHVEVRAEDGSWNATQYRDLSHQGDAMDCARHVRTELRANGDGSKVRITEGLKGADRKVVGTFNAVGALRWRY